LVGKRTPKRSAAPRNCPLILVDEEKRRIFVAKNAVSITKTPKFMYLSSFQIKNFKVFENSTFHFNRDFNILTGVNNSGKSTVLEALMLWETCFNELKNQTPTQIYQYTNGKKTILAEPEDWKLGYSNRQGTKFVPSFTYVNRENLILIRVSDLSTLFYRKNKNVSIYLSATFVKGEATIVLPFEVIFHNYDTLSIKFATENYNWIDFNRFFGFQGVNFVPIRTMYASPIATIVAKEDFETIVKVKHKIATGSSVTVLRNRLYELKRRKEDDFRQMQEDLSLVMSENINYLVFKMPSDRSKDLVAQVEVQFSEGGMVTDISMLGSGTLQIIELLLALYEEKQSLNWILLDEPDSHLHQYVQQRLFSQIAKRRDISSQIFMTTHNENLINTAQMQHLFHLEPNKENYYPITHQSGEIRYPEMFRKNEPGKRQLILSSLTDGNINRSILDGLETDVLLLVEGDTDALYLDILLKKMFSKLKFNYWITGGITELLPKLEYYKFMFECFKNKTTLWKKTILVFDRDRLNTNNKLTKGNTDQAMVLCSLLKQKFGINSYSWNSYTIESMLLCDVAKFKNILQDYLQRQNLNVENLDAVVDTSIEALKQRIVEKFKANKADIANSIGGQYKVLKKMGNDLDYVFTGLTETTFYINYEKAMDSDIANGNIAKYTDKHDMLALLRDIFTQMGKQLPPQDQDSIKHYLPDILETLQPHYNTWYQEWNELEKIVKVVL
jgi:predicted ATP-dependent endonuclease of OLD family